MEEWKQISFDGRYFISNLGNVKSIISGKERMLSPCLSNAGYLFIRIKSKAQMIHRLVALMFIPTENPSLHIDHIDGNKLNNQVDNLRWVTQKENNNNPITKSRISIGLKGSHRTEAQREVMSAAQKKVWQKRKGWKHSTKTLEKFKHRQSSMLGRKEEQNPLSKIVLMYDLKGKFIGEFPNSLSIKKQFGIARESVCRCCNGKIKQAGGYIFKYKDKEIVL